MEQNKDILRIKLHCKCISFSREVINAIYSREEYAKFKVSRMVYQRGQSTDTGAPVFFFLSVDR